MFSRILIEVLLRHQLIAVLLRLRRHVALVLLLRGERLEIARQRRAELIDQTLDLLRRRPLLQRLHQCVLRRVQGALGLGQIAFLDAERRRPQLLDHRCDGVARSVGAQPPIGVAQGQIHRAVVDHLVAAERQRLDRVGDGLGCVGVAHQLLALLDHRLGQRLGEIPLRQHEFIRHALAHLPRLVAGDQRHEHFQSGPRMGGEVLGGLAVDPLGVGPRQLQRHHRRLEQGIGVELGGRLGRHRREIALLALAEREARLGARHAIVVVGPIHQTQGTARRGGRRAHQIDAGHLVLDQLEPPFGHGLAADLDIGAERLGQRHGELDQPGAAALLRFDGLGVRHAVLAGGEAYGLALRRMGAHDQLAPLGHRQSAERLGARADLLVAVGQHDRRDAGIERRRHPGVEPEQRGRARSAGGEGGAQAIDSHCRRTQAVPPPQQAGARPGSHKGLHGRCEARAMTA